MPTARLSYIVVTDTWETIADLVSSLEAQTAASEIELVVVAPAPAPLGEAPLLASVTALRRDDGAGDARAAAVRAASGEVVALGETHVTHAPGWAQAVLDLIDGGADVVLPRMATANPGVLSAAAFAMDYGRYAAAADGAVDVPPYNAAFRRSVLLALPALDALLVPASSLDAELRSHGARVAQVSGAEAVTRHLNVSKPSAWVHERLLSGVLVAANRCRRWSAVRRGAYALATPAIAAVLVRRKLPQRHAVAGPGVVAALVLGCVVEAGGEAIGYVGLDRPRHRAAMARYETHKRAYVVRP